MLRLKFPLGKEENINGENEGKEGRMQLPIETKKTENHISRQSAPLGHGTHYHMLYPPKLAYKLLTGSVACICLDGCFCCHNSSADFGGGGLAGLFKPSIVLPHASRDWLRGGGGGFAGRTVEKTK